VSVSLADCWSGVFWHGFCVVTPCARPFGHSETDWDSPSEGKVEAPPPGGLREERVQILAIVEAQLERRAFDDPRDLFDSRDRERARDLAAMGVRANRRTARRYRKPGLKTKLDSARRRRPGRARRDLPVQRPARRRDGLLRRLRDGRRAGRQLDAFDARARLRRRQGRADPAELGPSRRTTRGESAAARLLVAGPARARLQIATSGEAPVRKLRQSLLA